MGRARAALRRPGDPGCLPAPSPDDEAAEYQEGERLLTELRRTIKADLMACADEIGPARPLVERAIALMDARDQAGPDDGTTVPDLATVFLMRVRLLAEGRRLAKRGRR